MAFLNFLKKKGNKEAKGLDLPPVPEGFGKDDSLPTDLPDFDDLDDAGGLGKLGKDDDFSDLRLGSAKVEESDKDLDFPDFPEEDLTSTNDLGDSDLDKDMGIDIPPIKEEEMHPKPMAEAEKDEDEDLGLGDLDDFDKELGNEPELESDMEMPMPAAQQRPVQPFQLFGAPVRREVTKVPKFVKTSDYRAILKNINSVTRKLNDANAIVNKLNSLEKSKDNDFELWKTKLEDMQKKLLFVDKTLFEIR